MFVANRGLLLIFRSVLNFGRMLVRTHDQFIGIASRFTTVTVTVQCTCVLDAQAEDHVLWGDSKFSLYAATRAVRVYGVGLAMLSQKRTGSRTCTSSS
jgi:hypothetical protein